jgi:membrane glycosyltransferase
MGFFLRDKCGRDRRTCQGKILVTTLISVVYLLDPDGRYTLLEERTSPFLRVAG